MDGLEESLDELLPTGPAAEERPVRRFSRRDRAALVAGGAVLLLSPLLFTGAPNLALFRAQLLLSEYGHGAGALLLALALAAPSRGPKALALAAALLAFSPVAQALRLAPRLAAETGLAWGPPSGPRKPLSLARLFTPAGRFGVQRQIEAFAPAAGLSLSVWSPREDQGLMTRRPVLLQLHGGGWDSGQRDDFGDMNAALVRMGWVVADMDYRLAPAHPWPAQRDDIMRALEHLRVQAKRLAIDPEHVVLLGRSAGAHLALDFAYGTQDPAIQGVIALYGPSDLRYAWEHGRADDVLDSLRLLRQLCGGEPQPGGCFDDASPLAQVNPGSPPTLLLHGLVDELVWPRHSERLDERLAHAGVPHQKVLLPWATHGFDWNAHGPGGQAALFAIERFLQATERQKLQRKRL